MAEGNNEISIFIDSTSPEGDEDQRDAEYEVNLSSFVPRNILAFDDAVLETHEEYEMDRNCDEEDTQSRSSSTDLNNFLQIKQNLGQTKLGDDDEAASMQCSIAEDNNNNEKPKKRTKFRRRTSIAPLPAYRCNSREMMANDLDSHSVITQNSISSINSLASLLKEKMQMVPSLIKKKKKSSKDFNIKAFVAILFLVIVFLIGYAYIMYNQKVLAKLYFDRIKFDKEFRKIRVYDEAKDLELISGSLGLMPLASKPFRCLKETNLEPNTLCLEWDGLARLYVSSTNITPTIPCYNIRWQALADDLYPTDCYDVDEEEDHWYGGGLTRDAKWPLEKDSFDFSAFITGDARVQQFGNAMKRYFINSRGVAIKVDDRTPLYVSMNRNGSRQFCLKAMNDHFAFVNRLTPRPELAYKICTSDNMKLLHKHMTQHSLWDGVKEEENDLVILMLEEPVWQIQTEDASKMTQKTIEDFTEEVVALGFLRLGHVLINEFWQKNIGDFTLEKERFPSLGEMVDLLHRRGFRILFTIQPFISTNSPNFEDAVDKKLLIYERLSERSIPALTRYKSSASAGVIDMTNNRSIPWLLEKLDKVVKEHKVDGFYIDFGTAYNMPHYYQCSKSLDNPDQYKTFFTNALNDGMVKVIGQSSANSVPRPPTFLSLPPVNSSWMGLQSVITATLSYGILGFPFILPGPIGGDYFFEGPLPKSLSFYSLGKPPLPEEELYIRWMQLATFLPVIRFTHLPSEYKSEYVMDVAKELMSIRQKVVIPILKKYFQEAMDEALPLIRPLWMLDAQDPACLYVHDEFSVGIELIVAPILSRGQFSREVYLPPGVWKDGIDGSLRKGSRWLHNYRVPKEKVAYFVKMPDNTRF